MPILSSAAHELRRVQDIERAPGKATYEKHADSLTDVIKEAQRLREEMARPKEQDHDYREIK